MEEEKRKAYSEVVEVLKLIDDEKMLESIPFEVVQLIKGNADSTYKPEISKEIPLEEQNLMEETYRIIAWIASKYWGENIEKITEEKSDIVNENNVEEIIEEKNETVEEKETEVKCEENVLPMIIKETKWYEKIKTKVINFLKKLFKKKELSEGVN